MQAIYALTAYPRCQQLELQDIVIEAAFVVVLQHEFRRSLFERASQQKDLRAFAKRAGHKLAAVFKETYGTGIAATGSSVAGAYHYLKK